MGDDSGIGSARGLKLRRIVAVPGRDAPLARLHYVGQDRNNDRAESTARRDDPLTLQTVMWWRAPDTAHSYNLTCLSRWVRCSPSAADLPLGAAVTTPRRRRC